MFTNGPRSHQSLRKRWDAWVESDPDGPLAVYRWVWNNIRDEPSGPMRFLRVRFVSFVLRDLVCLGTWSLQRLYRRAVRSATPAGVLASLFLLGFWLWGDAPDGTRVLSHAVIQVSAEGSIWFDGERVGRDELPALLESHDLQFVSVTVDESASSGVVFSLQETLQEQGVSRVKFRVADQIVR